MRQIKNAARLLLLFFLLTPSLYAQAVTIPDALFRSRVLAQVPGTSEVGNQVIFTTPAVSAVTALDLSFASITNLTGIEAFTGLVSLNCGFNPSLGAIDVSNNPLLEELTAFSCGLAGTLDLTANPAMRFLSVQLNALTGIDISNCPLLEEFNCNFNQLTALDVTNKPQLRSLACQENQIATLDVTGSPLLRFFICSVNNISALDVCQNPLLEQFRCNVNNISALDLSNSPLISDFNCSDNQLTTLDLSGISPFITQIFCANNLLTSLVLGNKPSLTYLSFENNPLTTIDISQCPSLEEIYCGDNILTALDVSNCPSLTVVFCFRNQITALDFSNNPSLERLECGFNQLTSLVGLSANLFSLDCADNQLTALDISNCASLQVLRDGVEIASYPNHASLRGRGTTSETTQYSFTDASVEVGRTYRYSLRSFDFNGMIHDYPNTVSVEVTENSRQVFRYELSQNYPNPFNPSTMIEYELASAGEVRLEVFDMLGRKVTTLVGERQSAGTHRVNFNAANLSSGVYFYTIQSGRFSQTKKMLMVK